MFKQYFLLLFYFEWIYILLGEKTEELINLSNGKIRGHFLTTFKGNTYLAFQEIPYAAPSIGELRFKDPIPPKNWDDILNTTKNTKICFQLSYNEMENEDCLYLNVYTPVKENLSKQQNLSVLFYIYGGAFTSGDGTFDSLGPEFFIDHNLVVVTFNYRLGPFGFLSTQDDVILGNQALKDQHFALEWVNTNIHLFGGNPLKITIVGESAGAAGVGYQLVSTKSKGLFRAAILESSTSLCSWAYQKRAKEIAYQLGTAIDPTFDSKNSSIELLKLLQAQRAEDIRDAVIPGLGLGIQIGQGNMWAPVIEVESESSFITQYAHETIENGNASRVPLIIGVNSEELIYLAKDLNSFKNEMAEFDKNESLLVNEDFNIQQSNLLTAGKEIRNIYTKKLFQEDLGAAIRYRSDARYTTAVIRHADLQSKYSDVYFYQFSYDGVMGNKLNIIVDGADRVAHAAELNYLWSSSRNKDVSQFPLDDVKAHSRLVTLWANFVKYLNPTPTEDDLLQNIIWSKVSSNNFTYLNINETLEVRTDPKEYKNWKKVIDKFGNPPFITY